MEVESVGRINSTSDEWTLHDIELVSDESKCEEELAEITGRTIKAIRRMRYRVCGRSTFSKGYWTKADDDLIRAGILTDREVASITRFSEAQVKCRRHVLESTNLSGRLWTPEEDEMLLHGGKTNEELADELNRTVVAIENRREQLRGLRVRANDIAQTPSARKCGLYPKRPWTLEEDEMVERHEIPDRELSSLIQRSVTAIQKRRHELRKSD